MPRPPAKTYLRPCHGVGGVVSFYEYGLLGPGAELWPVGQSPEAADALAARDCLTRALEEIESRKKAAAYDRIFYHLSEDGPTSVIASRARQEENYHSNWGPRRGYETILGSP